MQAITKVAGEILSHMEIYLEQLSDDDYGKPLPLLSDASIGAHTRHILDGFLCLMRQQDRGVICYSRRERDPDTEANTSCASLRLEEIQHFIGTINHNAHLDLEVDYTGNAYRTSSSLERELIHNIEHAIHHLAIIKIALLAYHQNIRMPKEFGVAPSTLRYWESHAVKISG